jgi:hypothetical protein
MGDSGQANESSPLYSSEDHVLRSQASIVVHGMYCMLTWGSKEDCVRPRITVYFSVLEEVARALGYKIEF